MLELEPRFSRIAFTFLAGCHGGALLGLWMSALPPPLRWLMVVAVLLSLAGLCRSLFPRTTPHPCRIRLGYQECVVQFREFELRTEPPLTDYLGEYLVVLRFRPLAGEGPGRVVRLVLYPDSLPQEQDRRLRRYLRVGCG